MTKQEKKDAAQAVKELVLTYSNMITKLKEKDDPKGVEFYCQWALEAQQRLKDLGIPVEMKALY